jgi:phage shock protein B
MIEDLAGVLMIGVFAMVALRYLKFKSQTAGQMNAQEVSALEQMAETAQRLERRVATLERILDSEVPAWRDNPASFYQQASNER